MYIHVSHTITEYKFGMCFIYICTCFMNLHNYKLNYTSSGNEYQTLNIIIVSLPYPLGIT